MCFINGFNAIISVNALYQTIKRFFTNLVINLVSVSARKLYCRYEI